VQRYPYKPPTRGKHLVFLSHAGEQKHMAVDFLREGLEQRYPALRGRVFVDDISLQRGDDAMEVIYKTLRNSFVGGAPSFAAAATAMRCY
jgi:hypothetical protein